MKNIELVERVIAKNNDETGCDCSNCGLEYNGGHRVYVQEDTDDTMFDTNYRFKFCPRCGARFEEESK